MKKTNFLNKFFWLVLVLSASAVVFNSCDDDEPSIAVTSVNLNKTSLTLTVGSSEMLIATVLPDNATNRTVTWSSSNANVTVVNGAVTARAEGTATITARAGDRTATCVVTVRPDVVAVINVRIESRLALFVGESETLIATVSPDNATNKTVTWTSSNSNVATVDNNGKVTAVTAGTATITARAGNSTATCTVTVSIPRITVITIDVQPAASRTFTQGSISGSLSVVASVPVATLSYQWYSNTSNSNSGGSAISGATSASFTIPTTLTAGTYYYFCEVSATGGVNSVRSNVTTVTVNAVSLFCSGSGTQANPYMICTPAQLDAVRTNLSAHYKLANNINLSSYLASGGAGYAKWGALGWEPIGGIFSGNLDGAGYKITGLCITRSSVTNIGLFANVANGGKIQNLGVEVAAGGIIGGSSSVGGIVGYASGNNCIVNCYVTGAITGSGNVGGVVGILADGSITNCYATGTINGGNAGGVVGEVSGANMPCNVTNCYATGSVSGTGHVGGVAGSVDRGSLTSCYATGAVSSSNHAGGVVGFVRSGIVANCVALNPSITSTRYAGRVTAGTNSTTLSNNWAHSNMMVTVGPHHPSGGSGPAHENGVDCAATPTASWWTTSAGWSSTVWYFTNGQLPILQWQR